MALRKDFVAAVVLLAAFALALLSVTQPVSAIKCYQCNSKSHPHCEDIKANKEVTDGYIKECTDPDVPPNSTFFCRKIVQTILHAMEGGEVGEKRVVRKCGYIKGQKPCYHFDDVDHAEVVCQCFEDACNSAPGALPTGRTALAATASAALLLILAR